MVYDRSSQQEEDPGLLIALEGADATGKSTLAWGIANSYQLHLQHFDRPTQHPLDEYLSPLLVNYPAPPRAVFDRFHWGEVVWPRVFDRSSEMTPEVFTYLELAFASRGGTMILALGEMEDVAGRLERRGELDQLAGVDLGQGLFYELAQRSALQAPYYYRIEGPNGSLVEALIQAGHRDTLSRRILGHTGEYVGHLKPAMLLVGDVSSRYPQQPARELPFVPWHNTCGEFLLRSLPQGVGRSLGITNSLTVDAGSDHLRGLWEDLGRPATAALGFFADERLKRAGVDHGVAPHPQYVKRFHHRMIEEYGVAIVRAAEGSDQRRFYEAR